MSSGSLFYYVTYKYVLLKDARLGVLYYVLALLTVLYTVVEIFVRKGYMEVNTDHKCGCIMQSACWFLCCACTRIVAIVGKGSTTCMWRPFTNFILQQQYLLLLYVYVYDCGIPAV